jgi:RimJ/RimL family protein N-acetyltransferase
MLRGILVHGANHFIVSGPLPDPSAALRLVQLWEIPTLGPPRPLPAAFPWTHITKAFREDLSWAVVLASPDPHSAAVTQLLKELEARNVPIHHAPGPWLPDQAFQPWPSGHRYPEFILESERLSVREFTQSDVEAVEQMLDDTDVMLFFGRLFSRDQCADWIAQHIQRYQSDRCGYWLAIDKASGQVAGQAGILRQQLEGVSEFGLGYIFNQAFWGRGLATEAARACLRYGFHTLHLPRIVCTIRPENHRSRLVAERLGLRLDRTVLYAGFEHLVFVADAAYHEENQ